MSMPSLGLRTTTVALALAFVGLACDGAISDHGMPTGSGGSGPIGGGGPTKVDPGTITVPPMPLDSKAAFYATSKAKNLLTGLAVTDEDVSKVTERGAAGLQELISTWLTTDPYQGAVGGKLLIFFRNMFQQTGFLPTEDFKLQLLTNGGFDFGGSTRNVGDDAFPRLVMNLQDSFAMTAWQLVKEGRPFTETLTTRRFVMTTALKSLYVQIEMTPDNGRTTTAGPAWTIDFSGNAIPIETALTSMTFSDEAPAITTQTGTSIACRGGTVVATGAYQGTSRLFQRLLGFTPQFPTSGTTMCNDHASKPYFTAEDVSDWTWVTINAKASAADRAPVIQPYDLPALRRATELTLSLPRIGFYTTPAFLALWNTNDSNQHRVTANQTLLVAFGQAFTAENAATPFSTAGLDENHAVTSGECVGCHLTLDPMRQFWANQLDYNDRNDFPAGNRFTGAAANPRPATPGGGFAFGDVNEAGANLAAATS